MRRIGHIALGLLVVALLAGLFYGLRIASSKLLGDAVPSIDDSAWRPVEVVELDNKRWTRFALPARATRVRVEISAVLADAGDAESIPFAIDYRLTDDSPSSSRQFHSVVRPLAAANAGRERRSVTRGRAATVIPATDLFVDASSRGGVLELRQSARTRGIATLLVRVSERVVRDDREALLLWRRASLAVRERWAAASFQPPAVMSAAEGSRFSRVVYEPIGPSGVTNIDFVQRTIYETIAVSNEATPLPPEPLLVAAPGKPIAVPILAPTELFVVAMDSRGRAVPFKWQAEGAVINGSGEPQRLRVSTGIALLEPAAAAAITVYDAYSSERLVPTIGFTPAAVLSRTRPVSYRLLSVDRRPSALRIELRQRESQRGSAAPTRVALEGLDEAERILWREELSLEQALSNIDRVTPRRLELLTQPLTRELEPLPAVREIRVRLMSDEEVIVIAYTGVEPAANVAREAATAARRWVARLPEDGRARQERGEITTIWLQANRDTL
jgi:hypothetical protein